MLVTENTTNPLLFSFRTTQTSNVIIPFSIRMAALVLTHFHLIGFYLFNIQRHITPKEILPFFNEWTRNIC